MDGDSSGSDDNESINDLGTEPGHILHNHNRIRQAKRLINDPQFDSLQSNSDKLNRETVEKISVYKKSISVQKLPVQVMGVFEGRFLRYDINFEKVTGGF